MPIAASTGGVFTFTGTTHKRQPFWYPLSSFNNVTSSDYFQLLRELWCRGLCQGILSAAAILKNQSACHLVFDFPLKFFTIFRVAETIIKKCLFTNTLAILPDSMANHSSIFSVTSRLVKTIEKLRVELNWICHSVLTLVTWQEFGKGRVLVRSSHEVEPNHSSQPSFYRILWAQVTFETRSCGQSKECYLFYRPLMDKHTLEGRVVAERVRHGVRWNVGRDGLASQYYQMQISRACGSSWYCSSARL